MKIASQFIAKSIEIAAKLDSSPSIRFVLSLKE